MRTGNELLDVIFLQFLSDLGSLWGRFEHPIGDLEDQFWIQNGGDVKGIAIP